MYTLTVKIADLGTDYFKLNSHGEYTFDENHDAIVKQSKFGHMWYSIWDGNNEKLSFGFGPDKSASPSTEGSPIRVDDKMYKWTYYTATIVIDNKQYELLRSWKRNKDGHLEIEGNDPQYKIFSKNYDGVNHSCIDFTWISLYQAGISKKTRPNSQLPYEGTVWPKVPAHGVGVEPRGVLRCI